MPLGFVLHRFVVAVWPEIVLGNVGLFVQLLLDREILLRIHMDVVDVVGTLPLEVRADQQHVEAGVVGVRDASEALDSPRGHRASDLVGLSPRDAALLGVPAPVVVRLLRLAW